MDCGPSVGVLPEAETRLLPTSAKGNRLLDCFPTHPVNLSMFIELCVLCPSVEGAAGGEGEQGA